MSKRENQPQKKRSNKVIAILLVGVAGILLYQKFKPEPAQVVEAEVESTEGTTYQVVKTPHKPNERGEIEPLTVEEELELNQQAVLDLDFGELTSEIEQLNAFAAEKGYFPAYGVSPAWADYSYNPYNAAPSTATPLIIGGEIAYSDLAATMMTIDDVQTNTSANFLLDGEEPVPTVNTPNSGGTSPLEDQIASRKAALADKIDAIKSGGSIAGGLSKIGGLLKFGQ